MKRSLRAFGPLVSSLVLLSGLSGPVEAQGPDIEPDAPERGVAGCYAVTRVENRTFTLEGVGRPGWGEKRVVTVLPDTIKLSLTADHWGTVSVGRQSLDSLGRLGPLEPVPWREAGYGLRVFPDPWLGFHQFAHWRLVEGRVQVIWQVGLLRVGQNNETARVEQWIEFDRSEAGDFTAVVSRTVGGEVVSTEPIGLRPVSCPPERYFHDALVDLWRLTRGSR